VFGIVNEDSTVLAFNSSQPHRSGQVPLLKKQPLPSTCEVLQGLLSQGPSLTHQKVVPSDPGQNWQVAAKK
jgi:hypothetical protein